jgi:hypothetical protein
LNWRVASVPAAVDDIALPGPGVQPAPHVHAPLEASRRCVGGSTIHCSNAGAFGSCTGMTTSVSDTVPPARWITVSARATVDAVIPLNEYFV